MGVPKGRVRGAGYRRTGGKAGVAAALAVWALGTADAWGRAPSNDEYALLVLANQLRADPAAQGVRQSAVPPLVWSDALAAASREHSDAMAASQTCFSHDSCDGTPWVDRLTRFYPGWSALGENLGMLYATVEDVHAAWVGSSGHRANLLSTNFAEFGAGIASGSRGTFYTEDFGSAGLVSIPAIPAAAVLPRQGSSTARRLLLSHYSAGGQAPREVRALLGSQCVVLGLESGRASYGTYAADAIVDQTGCVPLVFEVVSSGGLSQRFPEARSILVGVGATCAERSSTLPAADCGAAPVPTPTPVSGGYFERLEVRLFDSGPETDRIQVRAVLRGARSWDPEAGSGSVAVAYGDGSAWSRDLPATCGSVPCMVRSGARSRVYRARFENPITVLTVVRREDGDWNVTLRARGLNLDTPAAGEVRFTLDFSGVTAEGVVAGIVQRRALVAH